VFAIINERLNQQLRARALSDDLTGALSRRGLRELGERMLAQQQRQPRDIAVLMVDADHFKAINDRHGHLVGDDVLRHLTQTLRDNLRVDALLARYGGEEFTVLLPVRQRDEALKVAERLRDTVARSPCESRSGPIPITVSIGVSYHGPGSTLEDDLSRADALLYRAKAEGRNRVVAEAA
jgi:diguanylate cyclase (GGDEF)-like protein